MKFRRETNPSKITGRSQCQVLFCQWQGIGPARTWRSAATAFEGHMTSSMTSSFDPP